MEDDDPNQLSAFLQTLNRALEDLLSKPLHYLNTDINSPAIKALLEIENRAPTILSPHNSILSNLTEIKTLVSNLSSYQYYTPRSFIQYILISYQISRVASSIQKEVQLCFDREKIDNLVKVLKEPCDDQEKLRALEVFEDRISTGFDLELQDFILTARLFQILDSVLHDITCPPIVREKAGSAIAALANFNKNVFVGNVLMGSTISTLISMGTSNSLLVLISLVKLIKGHLVDEIEQNGEIPRIIGLLSSEALQIRLAAMDCLLEMAYYSHKKVIEAMIECGLVEKLVFLQRNSALEDDFRENRVRCEEDEDEDECRREKNSDCCSYDSNPFLGCVAKLAVEVEVGEVMDKNEKKMIKIEILRRARAASVSEAEATTVVAQVLWGSHP